MDNAKTRPALNRLTRIGGLHHLLARGRDEVEQVIAYMPGEMDKLFSPAEQARLALGEPVQKTGHWGYTLTWVDMVAAARGVTAATT